MASLKIKKGDTVKVIAGKDKIKEKSVSSYKLLDNVRSMPFWMRLMTIFQSCLKAS